ncbi:MAG: hypothetical protein KF690_06970 [Bacteroidetes bacterium]|nr:hypothetical protein [Bacteroidota bacterium]
MRYLVRFCCLGILLCGWNLQSRGQTVRDYCVLLQAEPVTVSGQPRLRINWEAIPEAVYYYVDRKAVTEATFPAIPRKVITDGTTEYTDTGLTPGQRYEYRVRAANTSLNLIALGHIYAGLEAPVTHSSGSVALVIDSTFRQSLAPEIARIQEDLWADGFRVLTYYVDRTQDTPPAIRDSLRTLYARRPAGSAFYVCLLGRVPVPYSGNIAPDGHSPDHQGAWPADVYYADLDGSETWTDESVDNAVADRSENRNVPGDGKFDQNDIPGALEARVGRVDMYNLPAFGLSEETLLRRYLDKNHAFRTRQIVPEDRAFVRDEFQTCCQAAVSPFASTAWRNYTAFFGADSVKEIPVSDGLFDSLSTHSFRCGFAGGGGMYPSIVGFGTTDSFVVNAPKVVFWAMIGSYFGDWDTPDNVMRAALASEGWGLASFWAGRPYWPLHTLALGEPIGLSAWQAQGAGATVYGNDYGHQMVHITLLGDPTLRLEYPAAPVNAAFSNGSLTWEAPPGEEAPLGYYVYGKTPEGADFELLTPTPLTETSIIPAFEACGTGVADMLFRVRALYLVQNASGTHYRLSPGIQATGNCLQANSRPGTTAPPRVQVYPQPARHTLYLATQQAIGGTVSLRNSLGQEVYSTILPPGIQHKISPENLSSGIYLLHWRMNTGYIYTHTICIE